MTDELNTEILKRLEENINELKTNVKDLKSELKTDVDDLKSELKADVKELKSDIKDLRSEVKKMDDENKIEHQYLSKNIADLETSISGLNGKMTVIQLFLGAILTGGIIFTVSMALKMLGNG